jgi:hypothetical protein
MLFWFYKGYNDKEKARQTGKWEHLFHQSTLVNFETMEMEGRWFYDGFEESSSYNGTWKLENSATNGHGPITELDTHQNFSTSRSIG